LITISRAGVKRQAGQGGKSARSSKCSSLHCKKHCLTTLSTLQFLWSNSVFNKRKF